MRKFEYTAILWNAYRNASVHETAVQLNEAMNLAKRSVPYYSNENMIDIENKKITSTVTRFAIPPSFLVDSLESGLAHMRARIESGRLVLSLSRPYDEPVAADRQRPIGDNADQEPKKYPRMITKPFQSFLADVENFVVLAVEHDKRFVSTGDGTHRWIEGAVSRSAIVSSVFALESLINCIVADFRCRETYQLPDKMLKRTGLLHTRFDRIPLIERLYVTPYLCCSEERDVDEVFFDRGSTDFQLLQELINIRDSFAHSYPIQRQLKLMVTAAGDKIMYDRFKGNFWPVTQFPKDIFIIDFNQAERAKGIVHWAIQQLDEFLDGKLTGDNWMKKERIEFDPKKKE
jgi:hypothetical protein